MLFLFLVEIIRLQSDSRRTQIDKVKLVQRARLGVAHAKVKPLRVPPRVDVGLDDHVVPGTLERKTPNE